ncbi:MAG: hypothetical protein WBP55_05940 [Solirubrobacterales bacterium]
MDRVEQAVARVDRVEQAVARVDRVDYWVAGGVAVLAIARQDP